MLAVSLDTLPGIGKPPEFTVPGADPPYLPGVGLIFFRTSKKPQYFTCLSTVQLDVPPHGAFLLIHIIRAVFQKSNENA
jgi:hypothetical protein